MLDPFFLEPERGFTFAILLFAGLSIGSFLATCISRSARNVPLFAAKRSACAKCGAAVPTYGLVPVLGYLVLRGRCRSCGAGIDPLFPVVELTTAAAIAGLIWRVGLDVSAGLLGGLLFAPALVFLAFHDLRTGRLPDAVSLPLIVLGLVFALAGVPVSLADSALGVALGGGVSWTVRAVFRRLRGREGLGFGDVKLIAALGAWLGPAPLPVMISVAAAGAIAVLLMRGFGRGRISREESIAFGPFLALSGWLTWLSIA